MRAKPGREKPIWFVLCGEDRMALVVLGMFFFLLAQGILIAEVAAGRFPRFALGSAGMGMGLAGGLLFWRATPYGHDRIVRMAVLTLKWAGIVAGACVALVGAVVLVWGAVLALLWILKVVLIVVVCLALLPMLFLSSLLGGDRKMGVADWAVLWMLFGRRR